jgi:phage replication initiation protein
MGQKTTIDWLACRFQAPIETVQNALGDVFSDVPMPVIVRPRKSGWQGYDASADVLLGDMQVGMLAFGGERQRGWSYCAITGRGCEWVSDWDRAQDRLAELDRFETRRVDIALTTTHRKVTHEAVIEAYRGGLFATNGRPPKMTRIESERPEDGRTCYVGNRERDKFLRGYEWGIKNFAGTEVAEVDGCPIEDMYRLELELKAKTAALPVDLIDRRDEYFAGAYPYLQTVLPEVRSEILVMQRERGPQLDLKRRLQAIRQQWGSTLFTAMVANHGDFGSVWAQIVGSTHNDDLVRAGVLLVDHDVDA